MSERLVALARGLGPRNWVRAAFLGYFAYLCLRLLRFAAWARGEGPFVPRPESVAGILPVGHYTSFFAWARGGGWDFYLPAGLVIILGALALSLAFKRGFCGWICPVGTVWEFAALLGRRLMGGRNVRLPRWLDLVGRGVRYALAGLSLTFVAMVPLRQALDFRRLPYMWVADIKIVEGFANPLFLAVCALAFVVSMLFGPVWCRWLCPLGGLYSALGTLSPLAVHRDASACTSCGRCTAECHAFVDVGSSSRVWAPECDGCMDCVRACPAEDCLTPRALGRVRLPVWVWPLLVVGTWLAVFGIAKATGNWDTTIPVESFAAIIRSGLLEMRTPGGF